MKKILTILSVFTLMFCFSVAYAADGAEVYKSCMGCHGANGEKSPGGSTPLQGQSADKVLEMLNGYKAGTFGGKGKATMQNVVKKHDDESLKAVADYIATLK